MGRRLNLYTPHLKTDVLSDYTGRKEIIMATKKVLDICDKIHLFCTCTYSENEANPYRLYFEYYALDLNKHPYPTKHRKCIAKYGDIGSVLCMIKDIYTHNIHHRPSAYIISWCKAYYDD